MMRANRLRFPASMIAALGTALSACGVPRGPDPSEAFYVVKDGRLQSGIELGIDSDFGQQKWVSFHEQAGYMEARYPAGQTRGAVTFPLVLQEETLRVVDDFRHFSTLEVELYGEWNDGEIALRTLAWIDQAEDAGAPCWLEAGRTDDPFEQLRYSIPLDYFDSNSPADDRRAHLFAPAQLAFRGDKARTIRVVNLRMVPDETGTYDDSGCPSHCSCEE